MAKKVFSDFVTNIPAICNTIGADLTEFTHDHHKISGKIVLAAEVIPFEIYSVPGADDRCEMKMTIKGEDYYGIYLDVDRAHEILEKFTVSHNGHDALEMMTAEELKAEAGYDSDALANFGKPYAKITTVDGEVYDLNNSDDQFQHM